MGNYSRNDGCGNGGERRGVCSDACCPTPGTLAAQRVVRPGTLQGSGASSWTILLTLLEEMKASNTGDFDQDVLLDGHLSVALGRVLARVHNKQNVNDTTPEPISNKIC